MKVILTNSSKIFGGNERWTVSSAKALRDAGIEVTLLLRAGGIVEERITELGIRSIALPGFGGDANPVAITDSGFYPASPARSTLSGRPWRPRPRFRR